MDIQASSNILFFYTKTINIIPTRNFANLEVENPISMLGNLTLPTISYHGI